MGGRMAQLLSGTFILVGIFLFLTNYRGATSIISSVSSAYSNGVKTLQGR